MLSSVLLDEIHDLQGIIDNALNNEKFADDVDMKNILIKELIEEKIKDCRGKLQTSKNPFMYQVMLKTYKDILSLYQ